MMTEDQAREYIEHLRKYRKGVPLKSQERKYLEMFDASTNAFTDAYGYHAAQKAEEWAQHNPGLLLAQCIRAANIGLILARRGFLESKTDSTFLTFTDAYIQKELESLLLS